jgi:4-amino-4-deoxy-L-arabinose transferase-like glycosyltransferase
VPLLSFVFATGFLYRLTRRIYDPTAGLLAALFFVTSPLIVQVSRAVLSEMPTIALLMGSAYYLHRFCETQRLRLLGVFALLAGLSLAAKQLALFVFPAFVVMALMGLGVRRFLRRDVLIALIVMAVLSAPLVPLTLNLSRANVNWALLALTGLTGDDPALIGMVKRALKPQLDLPVLLMVGLGLLNMLIRRDGRALPFLVWILGVWACVITAGRWDPPRYGIYWVPALAVVAASLVSGWRRSMTTAIVCVAVVAAGLQARTAWRWSRVGIGGYEDAARYMLAARPGPTVLFNGSIDAGYFSFFMRKHDPARTTAVLRADKILSTSFMNRSMEELIQAPSEIYPRLHEFGIRFIVSEDRPTRSRALEWLRQEMRTPKFVERRRFRVDPDSAARGELVIYEYLDATPPDRDATLSMNIPLISRRISVTLGDLMDRKYLR